MIIQQGDVLLVPVAKLPEGATETQWDGVIAEGEHTGHLHRMLNVNVKRFESPDGDVFMSVPKRVILAHEKGGAVADHNPIVVEPGVYKIDGVRQYDYATKEAVRVMD